MAPILFRQSSDLIWSRYLLPSNPVILTDHIPGPPQQSSTFHAPSSIPSDPSCFHAYLLHNVASFPQMARFLAMYYGAFSLLGYKKLINNPVKFLNSLSSRILRTTAALCGAIGGQLGEHLSLGGYHAEKLLTKIQICYRRLPWWHVPAS